MTPQWTPEAMDEWADQFEPAPLVSMSIGGRDCLNTAAMLRHGAASLRRWEALKAAIKNAGNTSGHHERFKAALGFVLAQMERSEREP